DPKHTFYMNLHKEAARPDGLVVKVKKDGKTLFKLNPKRRPLKSEKPAAEKAPGQPQAPAKAKATTKATRRKPGRALTLAQVEAAKDAASAALERGDEAEAARIELEAFGEDA